MVLINTHVEQDAVQSGILPNQDQSSFPLDIPYTTLFPVTKIQSSFEIEAVQNPLVWLITYACRAITEPPSRPFRNSPSHITIWRRKKKHYFALKKTQNKIKPLFEDIITNFLI